MGVYEIRWLSGTTMDAIFEPLAAALGASVDQIKVSSVHMRAAETDSKAAYLVFAHFLPARFHLHPCPQRQCKAHLQHHNLTCLSTRRISAIPWHLAAIRQHSHNLSRRCERYWKKDAVDRLFVSPKGSISILSN
jgi:hypothetical protein